MEVCLLSRSKKVVIGVVSDLHCGSTVGIHATQPTALDDGGFYISSTAQEWLYDNWVEFHARLRKAAKGAELHYIINGDLVDGAHHGTTQIVSNHPNIQSDVLHNVLDPQLKALDPKSIAIIRGTEVHVGPSGSAEESYARSLVAQGYNVIREAETGNASHWHYRGMYNGALIDAAHHGRVGSRPWTKANGTLSLAAEITMEYAMRRERCPNLAIRSHMHQWVDTADNYPVRLIQTPAWQLGTAYIHRRHTEGLADVGGTIVTIESSNMGDITVERVTFSPDRPLIHQVA